MNEESPVQILPAPSNISPANLPVRVPTSLVWAWAPRGTACSPTVASLNQPSNSPDKPKTKIPQSWQYRQLTHMVYTKSKIKADAESFIRCQSAGINSLQTCFPCYQTKPFTDNAKVSALMSRL